MTIQDGDNPYAAPVSPLEDAGSAPISVQRELREWLGLTLADLLVYLATGAVVAMFFVRKPVVDAALAAAALLLSLAACPLGMKRDPQVSRLTNLVKVTAYPAGVALALTLILIHYLWWAGRPGA